MAHAELAWTGSWSARHPYDGIIKTFACVNLCFYISVSLCVSLIILCVWVCEWYQSAVYIMNCVVAAVVLCCVIDLCHQSNLSARACADFVQAKCLAIVVLLFFLLFLMLLVLRGGFLATIESFNNIRQFVSKNQTYRLPTDCCEYKRNKCCARNPRC